MPNQQSQSTKITHTTEVVSKQLNEQVYSPKQAEYQVDLNMVEGMLEDHISSFAKETISNSAVKELFKLVYICGR